MWTHTLCVSVCQCVLLTHWCVAPSVRLHVSVTLWLIRLRDSDSRWEQPLPLHRNNSYLADEIQGSQAVMPSPGDVPLLGRGGSEDNTVITS